MGGLQKQLASWSGQPNLMLPISAFPSLAYSQYVYNTLIDIATSFMKSVVAPMKQSPSAYVKSLLTLNNIFKLMICIIIILPLLAMNLAWMAGGIDDVFTRKQTQTIVDSAPLNVLCIEIPALFAAIVCVYQAMAIPETLKFLLLKIWYGRDWQEPETDPRAASVGSITEISPDDTEWLLGPDRDKV